MDLGPYSLAIIVGSFSGAASGAMKHLMEAALKGASKYLERNPEADFQMRENFTSFAKKVDARMSKVTADETVQNEIISRALRDPSTSEDVRTAFIGALMTKSPEKQAAFAHLLISRLLAEPEEAEALVAKAAIQAINGLTPNQLNVLAFHTALLLVPAKQPMPNEKTAAIAHMKEHVEELFLNLSEPKPARVDRLQLEALRCLSYHRHAPSFGMGDLWMNMVPSEPSFQQFAGAGHAIPILVNWWNEESMDRYTLTSIGGYIGQHIIEINTGIKCDFLA